MMPAINRVNPNASPGNSLPRPALRWVAATCAVMVWMLGLLAASPELHARVHHDADHAGHTCAVTLFSQGLDHPELGSALAPEPALVVVAEVIPSELLQVESVMDWLRPGRGPPVR
jgi:hypothetical protein